MDIPYPAIVAVLVVGIFMWAALFSAAGIMPMSDTGCTNYQNLRSIFTPDGVAIGCEYNGTTWQFNETLVNLTWHNTKELR